MRQKYDYLIFVYNFVNCFHIYLITLCQVKFKILICSSKKYLPTLQREWSKIEMLSKTVSVNFCQTLPIYETQFQDPWWWCIQNKLFINRYLRSKRILLRAQNVKVHYFEFMIDKYFFKNISKCFLLNNSLV